MPQRVLDITDPGTAICYGIVQVGPFDPHGVPVVAIRDLGGSFGPTLNRTSRSIEMKYVRSRIQPGDVLLSIKGTIGRVGVVPDGFCGNISREIARIRLNNTVNPLFFKLLLESEYGAKLLDQAVVGTTRAEVSIGVLKRLPIAIPDLEIQRRIVELIGVYDSRISLERATLLKLKNLKVGLSSDLLAGRVRTRPN
jgi:type I restriction enzyme S subunit